jgi:nucleotide-binding universal stress UspA family protein
MGDRGMAGRDILVPLDGSELAERALPAAAHIAQVLTGQLVLARTLSVPSAVANALGRQAPVENDQPTVEDELPSAAEYLIGLARPLRLRGLSVRIVVVRGEPAEALVELLSRLQIALVVMTTHGRTGLARLAVGSVANHLVRASHVPVLLLRPLLEGRCGDRLDRALVPLDGSRRSEAALDIAGALAGRLFHNVALLRVVALHDGAGTQHGTQREMETAKRYLDAIGEQLGRQVMGRASVQTRVLEGDPAAIIRRTGEECDLVIMATSGESGCREPVRGSVADSVLHDSGTPLLLICPE